MLRLVLCLTLVCGMIETGDALNTASAVCNFQDGKQLIVRYQKEDRNGKSGLPAGKLWTPGGRPMLLFTQSELSISNSQIPIGAYSMYVIPQKEAWTLILNKNVTEGSKYDEQQDLLRAETQVGQLSKASERFSVFFAHVAPKQCNMRMYYGKIGTWVEFKEK